MMSSPIDEQPRTARFFTSVRRIPLLIGKVGGTRLIGGPYTPLQFVIGALTLFAGYNTMWLWGPWISGFPIVQLAALVLVSATAMWASGHLPSTRRKVHHLAFDLMGAVTDPALGTVNGRQVRIPAPHDAGAVVLVYEEDEAADHDSWAVDAPTHPLTDMPIPTPTPSTSSAPTAPPTAGGFTSGLDRLLAQAGTKEG